MVGDDLPHLDPLDEERRRRREELVQQAEDEYFAELEARLRELSGD